MPRPQLQPFFTAVGSVMLQIVALLALILIAARNPTVHCLHMEVERVNHLVLDNAKVRREMCSSFSLFSFFSGFFKQTFFYYLNTSSTSDAAAKNRKVFCLRRGHTQMLKRWYFQSSSPCNPQRRYWAVFEEVFHFLPLFLLHLTEASMSHTYYLTRLRFFFCQASTNAMGSVVFN